jgi:predicted transposase/invertase (TIGR01784 family)
MKTDTIFYALFQSAPGIFFELMGQSPELAQDYDFRSVEVKQTAFRLDGVMLPERLDGTVYFGEVQFQSDEELYHRFFAELFLYLKQFPETHDWKGLLIYPRRSLQPKSSRLFEELLAGDRVHQVFLDELETLDRLPLGLGLAKLVVEPEKSAPEKARRLIERARTEEDVGLSRQAIIEFVETIIVYKFTHLSRKEIEEMLGLSELKNTRVYQEASEEGAQERQREIVATILSSRFGDLDRSLLMVVEALADKPSSEFMASLLTDSRDVLIEKFGRHPC